jgi:hypothetical protein
MPTGERSTQARSCRRSGGDVQSQLEKKLMVRIQENRTRAAKWTGNICPNVFKKLKMNIELSGKCYVMWNGEDGYEVQEKEDRKYLVNLEKRECTCRYWQLSGLPCCHAISSIYKGCFKVEDYIAPCYSIEAYKKTYQHVLQPVQGPGNWPTSTMPKPDPPAFVKMPGRPKTERRREQGEEPKGKKLSRVGIKMSCRLCGKSDHNVRRCPKNPEAGNKQYAQITREKTKKRKEAETSATAVTNKPKKVRPMPPYLTLLLISYICSIASFIHLCQKFVDQGKKHWHPR